MVLARAGAAVGGITDAVGVVVIRLAFTGSQARRFDGGFLAALGWAQEPRGTDVRLRLDQMLLRAPGIGLQELELRELQVGARERELSGRTTIRALLRGFVDRTTHTREAPLGDVVCAAAAKTRHAHAMEQERFHRSISPP